MKSDVGKAEPARLAQTSYGQLIADNITQYITIRETHWRDAGDKCGRCSEPWTREGCATYADAGRRLEIWRNAGLRELTPQPGDGPTVKR